MIGQTIGHYRITAEIGRGGMGVIYAAEDLTLGRQVAIKFLTPEMGTDPDVLERFRREARAASSLNHPNICTIFGLEHENDRNFIVMELMEGSPLSSKLVAGALKFADVLELGTQVADALDAAHAKGIIHRDIKPANIFVTTRGQAKVLDFGLAKLTHKQHVAETAAIGAHDSALTLTQSGTTVGTIAYMSPEQACGEPIDARSDLFSFAAVLYEMATGKLPFPGTSPAVVFNNILERAPVAPRELNPQLPQKFEEIILRGLEKDRELRYQSAAEMRAELRRLARDSSSGKMQSAAPRSTVQKVPSSSELLLGEAKRHKWMLTGGLLLVVALIATTSIGIFKWMGANRVPFDTQSMKVTRLTNHGEAVYAGISPDGKYVAYARRQGDRSLWVKAVNTGSHIQVIPPGPGFYQGDISFTPDGDYVYFAHHSFDGSGVIDLYSVPTLGGPVKKIVADVAGGATFSPDGKKITFIRQDAVGGRSLLMIANADGSGQQELAERKSAVGFTTTPSWSPDGRRVAVAAAHFGKDALTEVAVYPVAGGKPDLVLSKLGIGAVRWLTDSGFLLMAVDYTHGTRSQLYYQPYPKGEPARFTSDLNSYQSISLDAQQNVLAAVQVDSNNNLYVAPAGEPNSMRQVTRDRDLGSSVTWISNTRVAVQDPELRLSLLDIADGGNRDDVASDRPAGSPARCGENGLVAERLEANNVVNVWYYNLADGSSHRLSNGNLNSIPVCSPDGKSAYFVSQDVSPTRVMKVAVAGGEPAAFGPPAFRVAVSPDENSVLVITTEGQGSARRTFFAQLRASDGQVVQRWPVPVGAAQQVLTWTSDSKAFVYDILRGGNGNLWVQSLDAKEPRPLITLPNPNDYIVGAAYSPDGKQLAIVHGSENVDVLLFSNFRK